MKLNPRACAVIPVLVIAAGTVRAEPGLRLYIDADMSGNPEAGACIERGIRTALSEVDNRLAGRSVELVVRDHHGNTQRSKRHLEEYLKDDRALAVFSGMHSPPILANLEFINQNRILLLDPWAAAAPITRPASGENWVFRLSVDDRKAGEFFVRYAIQNNGFKRPTLLLETTGWGKSNEETIGKALAAAGVASGKAVWFNWGLNEEAARVLLRGISTAGADVIFLVANAPEGKTFARAMASLPREQRLPICSHWGITGGDFPAAIGPEIRSQFSLKFIQTHFSFLSVQPDTLGFQVLERAKVLFPVQIRGPRDIKAPAGFVHAYDLTRLLIAAVKETSFTNDIRENRKQVCAALESLKAPVRGLVKTYRQPFSAYDDKHPDAHEALGIDDLIMARYGDSGEIILEEPGGERK